MKSLLPDREAALENDFTTYSFCCPSRATGLRRQYAHDHRIIGNEAQNGGFDKFREPGHEASTIGASLQAAALTR